MNGVNTAAMIKPQIKCICLSQGTLHTMQNWLRKALSFAISFSIIFPYANLYTREKYKFGVAAIVPFPNIETVYVLMPIDDVAASLITVPVPT